MKNSKTVTKEQIINSLNSTLGLSSCVCEEIVLTVFEEILNLTINDQKTTIKNFGKFHLINKTPRPGFNIKAKTPVEISARTVMAFSPSSSFKNKINSETK